MLVRIYQREKTATQSGLAHCNQWQLQPIASQASLPDRLMGWHGGGDNSAQQIQLTFPSQQAAIAYAAKHGFTWIVEPEPRPQQLRKSYADNFKHNRATLWTH